jgi:hypothetical protein
MHENYLIEKNLYMRIKCILGNVCSSNSIMIFVNVSSFFSNIHINTLLQAHNFYLNKKKNLSKNHGVINFFFRSQKKRVKSMLFYYSIFLLMQTWLK